MPDTFLPPLAGVPLPSDPALFLAFGERLIPWEYDGWDVESLSWKTGCYIHAGLSNYQQVFEGPDALGRPRRSIISRNSRSAR